MSQEQIIKLVDETKDLTENDKIKIAYSLSSIECSLYVLEMFKRHNITIHI